MSQVNHGKRYYKQMALEVAVRNPERYEGFLRTYSKFDGHRLDDAGILDIYTQLYLDGVVTTSDFDADEVSEKFIRRYIVETKTHNNEWGFPTGYQAGFTRYLKTLSEFGFIYSQYNEPLRLSPMGKAVVSGTLSLSEAFALQSMRFWRKSPYRRVLNDFNFFRFILEVIQRLNEQDRKLSYPQFMLALFSDDGDVDAFLDLISKYKIGNDFDAAYSLAVKKYDQVDAEHGKVIKIESSFNDYGNTVFRVLQLTGFITIDYQGVMLLSINSLRNQLLRELMAMDFSIPETAQEDEEEYFQILGSLDSRLLNVILKYRDAQSYSVDGYNQKLKSIVETYELDKDSLAVYLNEVSDGKGDKKAFWYIQAPLKFEFLLSLYLYACYGDEFEYKPNYLCDESGIPYSHAPGNIGDIEVFNSQQYWLIEATLIKGKTQQVNSETINLFRHIDQDKKGAKYLSLVAPYIHDDTDLLIKVATVVTMSESNSLVFAKPYATRDFVEITNECNSLANMQDYTISFIHQLNKKMQSIESCYSIVNGGTE